MTAPIVYLGPSAPTPDALEALPSSDLRPPIRRGDLYRDRLHGGSVFVIIDGVFLHHEAVPPREIVDVLRDGALIVGASSMGAIRAAECWPAGMRGVGTIYRLYRRGTLTSDDEVAVHFDPTGGPLLRAAPLVNVRYAIRKARREGRIGATEGDRILHAAETLFFSERTWRAILERAGLWPDARRLMDVFATSDLKRADAIRALRRVARWCAADPTFTLRPRTQRSGFEASETVRERHLDALAGSDREATARALARAHLLDGHYARHALAIAAAQQGACLDERLRAKGFAASLLAPSLAGKAHSGGRASAVEGALALRLVLLDLWKESMTDETFAERLWAELLVAGELDAEVFRLRAAQRAITEAQALGLRVGPLDRHLAQATMAHAHGFPAWSDLLAAARGGPWPTTDFVERAEQRALVSCLRARLFRRGVATDKRILARDRADPLPSPFAEGRADANPSDVEGDPQGSADRSLAREGIDVALGRRVGPRQGD